MIIEPSHHSYVTLHTAICYENVSFLTRRAELIGESHVLKGYEV